MTTLTPSQAFIYTCNTDPSLQLIAESWTAKQALVKALLETSTNELSTNRKKLSIATKAFGSQDPRVEPYQDLVDAFEKITTIHQERLDELDDEWNAWREIVQSDVRDNKNMKQSQRSEGYKAASIGAALEMDYKQYEWREKIVQFMSGDKPEVTKDWVEWVAWMQRKNPGVMGFERPGRKGKD